jgi:CelD/BcsL family acetyltransferase involved in cellulose biosynthesis
MINTVLSSSSRLTVEIIKTLGVLEQLQDAWWALWDRCPRSTAFQSPAWLIPWWRYLGTGRLWTLAVRLDNCLVGLAAFHISPTGGAAEPTVLLLGTGVSDYLDVLVDPQFRERGCELISKVLGQCPDWERCQFDQLPDGCALLEGVGFDGISSHVEQHEVCPALSLTSKIEQLKAVIPRAMLANVRYYQRRLRERAQFRIERADHDTFEEFFSSLIRLHSARWAERGQVGVISDFTVQQFHREAAFELLSRNLLRLYGLRAGDDIIAVLYAFGYHRTTSFYLSGFDPAWKANSPGVLLIAHAIEEAVGEQCKKFDFLRGREPYKYLWGAKDKVTWRYEVRRPAQFDAGPRVGEHLLEKPVPGPEFDTAYEKTSNHQKRKSRPDDRSQLWNETPE